MLIYLAPDELTPAAESTLVHRLLEDGENPNDWTVLAVWASISDSPSMRSSGRGPTDFE